jgi:ABC-type polysaccharide/polyol phosphate export permease
MISFWREIFQFREVLEQLVRQHFILKYRRTLIGILWPILSPLFSMAISAIVFSMVFRMPVKDYSIFLFSAMIPWMLFSNTISASGKSIIQHEYLVKKVFIPMQIFPIQSAITVLIDTGLAMGALFILGFFLGLKLSPALLFLPIAFLLVALFSFGLGLIISVVMTYARDVEFILPVIIQAGYFLTPILYPMSMIPEKFHPIYNLNPMLHFIDLFRAPIYLSRLPDPSSIFYSIAFAGLSIIVGNIIFQKNRNFLVFRL